MTSCHCFMHTYTLAEMVAAKQMLSGGKLTSEPVMCFKTLRNRHTVTFQCYGSLFDL